MSVQKYDDLTSYMFSSFYGIIKRDDFEREGDHYEQFGFGRYDGGDHLSGMRKKIHHQHRAIRRNGPLSSLQHHNYRSAGR